MSRYNYEQRPFESDEQYFRRLSKVVDQRMLRLDKLSNNPKYANVDKFSKAYADKYLKSKGLTKFNQKMPTDKRALRGRINVMRKFLGSKTTSKRDIDKIIKTVNKINSTYNTNLTWQDYTAFYQSKYSEKINDKYKDSVTVLKAIDVIASQPSANDVKKAAAKNVIVSDDKVVDVIAKRIANEGYTLLELFNRK